MLATASGFALLAALSPTALLVCAIYLGSASPRRAMLFYLCGAVAMTLAMGIVVLIALRAGGLSMPSRATPRYGLRIGLGLLALSGGIHLIRRRRRAASLPVIPVSTDKAGTDKAGTDMASTGKEKKPGLVTRMMNRPGPLAAFLTGILVFLPSASFVAAVQTIATAHASVTGTALALAAVVAIDVMFVWLPLLLYLARPEATARRLHAFNGWLRVHGRSIGIGALLVAGLLLVLDGVLGLV